MDYLEMIIYGNESYKKIPKCSTLLWEIFMTTEIFICKGVLLCTRKRMTQELVFYQWRKHWFKHLHNKSYPFLGSFSWPPLHNWIFLPPFFLGSREIFRLKTTLTRYVHSWGISPAFPCVFPMSFVNPSIVERSLQSELQEAETNMFFLYFLSV